MIGQSDAYETFATAPGDLYRSCVKEWGRCISRQYIDLKAPQCPVCTSYLGRPDEEEPWYCDACDREVEDPVTSKQVGWVFLSRQKYEGATTSRPEDFYLREVWVTVLDGPDTVVRTEHLHHLD